MPPPSPMCCASWRTSCSSTGRPRPSLSQPCPVPPALSQCLSLMVAGVGCWFSAAAGAGPQAGVRQERPKGQMGEPGPRRGKPGPGAGLSLPSHMLGPCVSSQQETCRDPPLPPFPSGEPVCYQLPELQTVWPEATMWMVEVGPGGGVVKTCGS